MERRHQRSGRPETPNKSKVAQPFNFHHNRDVTLPSSTDPSESLQFLSPALFLQAATTGNIAVLQAALSAGIDINILNLAEFTPLHHAARKGHLEIVRLLIANNFKADIKSIGDTQPVHVAAKHGKAEVVRILLACDEVGVNTLRGWRKQTLLHIAAVFGHLEVVILLLQHDAIDIRNCFYSKLTILQLSALSGHWAVAQAFLDHEKNGRSHKTTTQTPQQAPISSSEVVKELLTHKDFQDVNVTITYWETRKSGGLLHAAVRNNDCDVIQLLLNVQEIDPNLKGSKYDSETPLFLATSLGRTEAVRILLQHDKIDVNKTSTVWSLGFGTQCTSLQFARQNGFDDIVDLLLAHGAIDHNNDQRLSGPSQKNITGELSPLVNGPAEWNSEDPSSIHQDDSLDGLFEFGEDELDLSLADAIKEG
ncbi:ankyrin repeat-containing domain protein [Phaeosphaeriaceae sp. PMI808]|nr:ankyrin repeat-containing domain protein [Phaeosphaeriaceae sp. PMI808]